jgi:hypothetical protein
MPHSSRGRHAAPKRGDRPSPRWFDRGIPAKGGPRRVELPHLVKETRKLTVIPLPEGCGGPSRFPGDLRRGPVHPARRDLESRVAFEPKLGGISEETGCGGGYAYDRGRARSALSLIPLRGAVSRAAPLSPVRDKPA